MYSIKSNLSSAKDSQEGKVGKLEANVAQLKADVAKLKALVAQLILAIQQQFGDEDVEPWYVHLGPTPSAGCGKGFGSGKPHHVKMLIINRDLHVELEALDKFLLIRCLTEAYLEELGTVDLNSLLQALFTARAKGVLHELECEALHTANTLMWPHYPKHGFRKGALV